MISRAINLKHITTQNYSVFLFGPRGVGKTSLLNKFDDLSLRFDLLNSETFRSLKLDLHSLRDDLKFVKASFRIYDKILRKLSRSQAIRSCATMIHITTQTCGAEIGPQI